jgi:exodeoxyribonuclease VII small subunit
VTETPPEQLTYGQAVEELNAIIAELDEGLVDVDALTARFQRAIDIMEDLDARIRRARAKVDELAPRLDAIARGPATSGEPPAAASPDPPATTFDYGDEPF